MTSHTGPLRPGVKGPTDRVLAGSRRVRATIGLGSAPTDSLSNLLQLGGGPLAAPLQRS